MPSSLRMQLPLWRRSRKLKVHTAAGAGVRFVHFLLRIQNMGEGVRGCVWMQLKLGDTLWLEASHAREGPSIKAVPDPENYERLPPSRCIQQKVRRGGQADCRPLKPIPYEPKALQAP